MNHSPGPQFACGQHHMPPPRPRRLTSRQRFRPTPISLGPIIRVQRIAARQASTSCGEPCRSLTATAAASIPGWPADQRARLHAGSRERRIRPTAPLAWPPPSQQHPPRAPHSPDGPVISQPIRLDDQAGPEHTPRRGQQHHSKHAADDDTGNRSTPHGEVPRREQGQHHISHSAPGPLWRPQRYRQPNTTAGVSHPMRLRDDFFPGTSSAPRQTRTRGAGTPTTAKTAAIPMVGYRRETTDMECRARRQPLLDSPGRSAHAYG
jgi:hypothetical protein